LGNARVAGLEVAPQEALLPLVRELDRPVQEHQAQLLGARGENLGAQVRVGRAGIRPARRGLRGGARGLARLARPGRLGLLGLRGLHGWVIGGARERLQPTLEIMPRVPCWDWSLPIASSIARNCFWRICR